MKKIYLLLISCILLSSGSILGQVTISGSTGTANGTYTSLTNAAGAFAALNAGGSHNTGDVILISITADVTTEAGTNSLNAGTWASITITPNGTRVISGSLGAAPLINFNGADNVTIDGLNSGGNSLTISNTSTAATSGTSTIRFIADAVSNTITNCSLLGSATVPLGTNGGTIFFSTGTTTGNDNNTISNNNIGPAGVNLPTKAIYANGSTGAATRNSGVTINNNNIFDFFNATTSVSGIHILSGNDVWTVSNNRIYQTTTRIFTATALRYAGITLNSTTGTLGSFTITNNVIGFAASNGTGTTIISGSTNEFRGIDALSVNITSATSIQGNTISGIAVTTARNSTATASGSFTGISLGAGTDGLFSVTGNTIGSLDASSSVSITSTSTTASTAPAMGILDFSLRGNTISSNNVGTITLNSGGVGTVLGFRGILIATGTGLTATLNNNIIGGTAAGSITNNIIGNGVIYGIQVSSSNVSATGNIVRNMTGSSTAAASIVLSGILTSGSTGVNTITQNSIYGLQNNSGAANNSIYALYCSFPSTANIVERNIVHSLSINSTALASQLVGILPVAGSGTYKNNMVRLGVDAAGASVTGGYVIYGIFEIAGANNIYHNSVYVGGGSVVSVSNTFAFVSNVTSGTRNYINNIFWNARSNASGTGKNYAISVPGTAPNPVGLTTDYNDLYATGTGGFTGNYNAVDRTTIGDWRTATGQDANSVSGNPQFLAPDDPAATVDLHISAAVPTQIEGAGTLIASVTDDYDGQTRSGLTPVDIGADAGNFIALDLSSPSITAVVNVGTACNTTSRTVTATIADITGVDNGTYKPTIYFNKNGGAYVSATGTLSSGSLNNGSWSFTINYALVGGVTVTDVIRYFIVAQDVAAPPNVGGVPSAGLALTDVNTITTPPTTPFTYTISAILNGTYLVGVGQIAPNYATLTAAIASYNSSCLGGPVVFQLLDASYSASETFPMTINNPGAGASGFSLTIKPGTGVTASITGVAASTGLMNILNNNVIIDGSNVTAGTSRDLTISNTGVTAPSVIGIGSTGLTAINNVTVKNSILINGINTNSAVVVGDGAATGTAGYFNNITIQNNSIQRAFMGVFNNAVVSTGNGSGLLITGNDVNTSGANSIRLVGIYAQGVDGVTITGNNIGGISDANAESPRGIWLATGTNSATVSNNTINGIALTNTGAFAPAGIYVTPGSTATAINISNNNISNIAGAGTLNSFAGILFTSPNTNVTGNSISSLSGTGASSMWGIITSGTTNSNITGNTISGMTTAATGGLPQAINVQGASTNLLISNNRVSNIKQTNSGGYNAVGLALASSSTASNITVQNNFIWDIAGYGFNSQTTDNGYGINIFSGGGYKIYYNTISMATNQTLTTGVPAAMIINAAVTTAASIDLRNNIFSHEATVGTNRYALLSNAANSVFSNIDNNVYYSSGTNIGYIGATNRANLAAMQAGFGGNVNSLNVQPVFVSASDLHLLGTNNCGIDGRAVPIVGITVDIDANTRDASTPDIGADEFTPTLGTTLYTTASTTTCDSRSVDPSGATFRNNSCMPLASVVPSGASPVTGMVNTCVYINPATNPSFNAEPYVQRHFDIEPATSPATATATVTLYFTDAEFVTFNANNAAFPDLPTVAGGGNADPNLGNVRITQYHGTPTTTPSTPGNYTIGGGAGVRINPASITTNYNGNYWEVTFPVTGFSGFYLHTNVNYALPITMNYFRGTKQGSNHLLNWKVTCNSTPKATLVLERSSNANGPFNSITSIDATAARCNQPFDYTDAHPLNGMNYYRLKMIDADGKVTYSGIVALLNATKGFEIVGIAPNPVVNGNFKLNVTTANAARMDVMISDMQGRIVQRSNVALSAGFSSIDMNVNNLASGTYNLVGMTAEGKSTTIRFVKK